MDREPQSSGAEQTEKVPANEPPTSCNVTGEYWRWCPRCGAELHNEKCKLRCTRCHYFMSCSDFD
jgi:hypothetical protein